MKQVVMFATLALFAALGGCATMSPQQTAAMQSQAQATIPHCSDQRQCEGEWAAARDWVTSNCAMKIQTITDSYISTYNATNGEPGLACDVTKEPVPSGGYAITIAVNCDNIFGCVPDRWSAILAFNKAVAAAGAQFAGK